MAVWFRRVYGWARKGAETISTGLGFGSEPFGESPFGDPE
jgi:hypothetical protein